MNDNVKTWAASVLFMCLGFSSAFGQNPDWWLRRGVLSPQKTPDDYALINQGQLKMLALGAYQEIQAKVTGGAGEALDALISRWMAPAQAGVQRDDYAVVTLGQLKQTAAPFYDRLMTLGLAYRYPWTDSTIPADDRATANIGQAKMVFAFIATGLHDYVAASQPPAEPEPGGSGSGGGSSSGGNTSSSGENAYLLDSDNDGWSDLRELAEGSNPNDTDSDNDGVKDPQDAVPYDRAFKHPRTAVPRFLPLPLYVIDEEIQGNVMGAPLLGENGTVYWHTRIPENAVSPGQTADTLWVLSASKNLDAFQMDSNTGELDSLSAINSRGDIAGVAWVKMPGHDNLKYKKPWRTTLGGLRQNAWEFLERAPDELPLENRSAIGVQGLHFSSDGTLYGTMHAYPTDVDSYLVPANTKLRWPSGSSLPEMLHTFPAWGRDTAPRPVDVNTEFWQEGETRKMGEYTYEHLGFSAHGRHLLTTNSIETQHVMWTKQDGQILVNYVDPGSGDYAVWEIKLDDTLTVEEGSIKTKEEYDLLFYYDSLPRYSLTHSSPDGGMYPWISRHVSFLTDDYEWVYEMQIRTYDGGYHSIYASPEDKNQDKPLAVYYSKANSKGWVIIDEGREDIKDRRGVPMRPKKGLWINGRLHDWDELVASPDMARFGSVRDWDMISMNEAGQVLMTVRKERPLRLGETRGPNDPIPMLTHLIMLVPVETMGFDKNGNLLASSSEGTPPSAPSPIIDISKMEVKNLSYETATGRIVGAVTLQGKVTSAFCDTVGDGDGTISKAMLRVNDADDQNLSFNLNVTKTRGNKLGKPFPYEGAFNLTLNNVVLNEGVNTLSVIAADRVNQLEGYNTYAVNIQLTEVPGTGLPAGAIPATAFLALAVPQGANAGDETPPTALTATLTMDQQVVRNGVTLNRLGYSSSTALYRETAAGGTVTVLLSPGSGYHPGLVDRYSATYVDPALGFNNPVNIPVMETGASSQLFSATAALYRLPHPTTGVLMPWRLAPVGQAGGVTVAAAPCYPVEASTGGDFHPFVVRLGLPEGTPNSVLRLRMGTSGSYIYTAAMRQGSSYYLHDTTTGAPLVASFRQLHAENGAHGDINETAALTTLRKSLPQNTSDPAAFLKGVAYGLGDGGVEMVAGTTKVVKGTFEHIADSLLVLGLSAVVTFAGADNAVYETNLLQNIAEDFSNKNEAIAGTARQVADLAWTLARFAKEYNEAEYELVLGFLTGDSALFDAGGSKLSGMHRAVFMMGAEVLGDFIEEHRNDTPEQQGRLVGRALFEVAAVALPFTKVGQLGNLGKLSKLEFLQKLKLRPFFKGNGPGAGAMGRVEAGLMPKLAVTKMCFVAGTVVLTREAGLVPIEKVSAGMWVWSRDEFTGEWGWRRVVETFTTHPEELYRLSYRVRGPPESGATVPVAVLPLSASQRLAPLSETLGVTGPHPFWVCSQGGALSPLSADQNTGGLGQAALPSSAQTPAGRFVPAAELQPGDVLLRADGGTAEVVGNVQERAPAGQTFTTYNFEVEGYHTYFVGEAGVWVHNVGEGPCQLARSMMEAQYAKHGDIWRAFQESQKAFSVDDISMRTRLRMFNETRAEYFAGRWGGAAPPWEEVGKQTLRNNEGSSKLLGQNLKAVGIEAPWGDGNGAIHAHHICPKGLTANSQRWQQCRDILQNADVDIDEAANGAFLRAHADVDMLELGLPHRDIHSPAYAEELFNRLNAAGPGNIREVLQQVANDLVQGTFPH